ncbi:MAG: 2OG-Fe(II) oxygenase [Luminiphilus sp.]|jgi:predicted 2-oxoglutarate/Fe(II)-dependent dioxygenase YbiX
MKLITPAKDPMLEYSTRMSIGDYVPYAYINTSERVFDVQGKAGEPNILLFLKDSHLELTRRALQLRLPFRHFVFTPSLMDIVHSRWFHSAEFCNLFQHELAPISAFVTDANLKIVDFVDAQTLEELQEELAGFSLPNNESPAPVLVINNAIDEALAEDLIEYIDAHQDEGFVADKDFKRRLHIHPSADLEKRLDDKLTKSVLPEIEKVFYSEITHRETYKICRYAGENSGKFGKHRDTIFPHLHRRYAMTLVLNDDYEGGGISFPEYSPQILRVRKYGAVIFPGSLFHQVNEIGSGNRYVIISFFFGETEAIEKEDSERYRFKVKRNVTGLTLNSLIPS